MPLKSAKFPKRLIGMGVDVAETVSGQVVSTDKVRVELDTNMQTVVITIAGREFHTGMCGVWVEVIRE